MMNRGIYKVSVNNFEKRESSDVGFVVEVESEGKIYTYSYKKALKNGEKVKVVSFHFDGNSISDINLGSRIEESEIGKDLWGCKSQQFHTVSLMTISPNHWDDNKEGNKHYFFMLNECKNEEDTRGLYNEFLSSKLHKHRKVFEVLGKKLMCEKSDHQLSGLGFSSTKRDQVLIRVSGDINRLYKVKF